MIRRGFIAIAAISTLLAIAPGARAQALPPETPPPPTATPAPTTPKNPEAKLTAEEILRRMEANNNGYADQKLEERLTVVDVDGTRKSYEMTVYQKGSVKRVVDFNSGEMKGMSMLVESHDVVYVYLPGFKKVRRLASSNMNQSLVGSDISSEDMATVSWAEKYDVRMDHEDDTSWWLVLTPKPGIDTDYAKVTHRVNKAISCQQETHFFNKAGEEVKRMMSDKAQVMGGVMRYTLVTFSDPRSGHRSELETTSAKFNQGIPDDFFTVRQLQWGK